MEWLPITAALALAIAMVIVAWQSGSHRRK